MQHNMILVVVQFSDIIRHCFVRQSPYVKGCLAQCCTDYPGRTVPITHVFGFDGDIRPVAVPEPICEVHDVFPYLNRLSNAGWRCCIDRRYGRPYRAELKCAQVKKYGTISSIAKRCRGQSPSRSALTNNSMMKIDRIRQSTHCFAVPLIARYCCNVAFNWAILCTSGYRRRSRNNSSTTMHNALVIFPCRVMIWQWSLCLVALG